jgi:hypothetical protein
VDKLARLEEALREYQRFNHIRNDFDAYLWEMGRWALGEIDEKPSRKDYGLPEEEG